MAGRKSLRQELEELINSMPKDLDPEANELDTAAALPEGDAQLDALTNHFSTGRGGKLAMRAAIELEDEAYKGRRTSRKAWFDEEQQGDGQLGDDDDDEGDGDDEGEDDDDGEGEEEEEEEQGASKRQKRAGAANGHAGHGALQRDSQDEGEDEEGSSEGWDEGEDDEGEEQPSEEGGDAAGGTEQGEEDEELKRLEAGYQELQEAEGKAVAQLQERGRKDAVKGRAARHQQQLYERCLELRIMLQKGVLGANRMPLPHTVTLMSHLSQPAQAAPESSQTLQQLQGGLQGLQSAAKETLSELMSLHDTLVTAPQGLSHGAVPAPASQPAADDSLDAFWDALSARYDGLATFRDASIDRWHSRAVLGSGSATLQGNLRALHQTISKQVSSMMQDPHKLIQRCRVAVTPGHRHLGEPRGDEGQVDGDGEEQAQDHGYGGVVSRDEETFDDGEFYQQLLKEFLEQGGAGDGLGSAKAAKKRKLVDRRASKGRKIRYNVQEKLVNFMSAAHLEPPMFAEQLFANLFGHSSTAQA